MSLPAGGLSGPERLCRAALPHLHSQAPGSGSWELQRQSKREMGGEAGSSLGCACTVRAGQGWPL